VKIGYLHPDGKITEGAEFDPTKCPHFIMVEEHYRQDGSCRCNDPSHVEMSEWEYTWKDGRWQ
jgi:hypothetical protein